MRLRVAELGLAGVAWFAVAVGGALAAEQVGAVAAVSSRDVFVGEAFQFQIQISGSESPVRPDVGGLTDFHVQDLGGQQNSSRSVTIVNGQMSQVVKRGYILNYLLTAKRPGSLIIPVITVKTDRGTVSTQPVAINAREPMETDNFKLRVKLSRAQCTVGEPVRLTVTWYLGQDVRGFQFGLPVLADDHFEFADPRINQRPDGQYYRIPLGGEEAIGEKGRGTLDGRQYATITFSKILIPAKAGVVRMTPATVACEALVGYREAKRRDPFGSMFDDDFMSGFFSDDFFGRRKGVYNRVVVPSNELTLDIRPLPAEGRPANFAGHVGEYHIEAAATPTEVSVGDPITLSIVLSGPDYLEHVGLPVLQQQADLVRDFKIPAEMAAGKPAGDTKVFTQTIRARRAGIREIPAIELPYFDTVSGAYRVARSAAIPLKVRDARVVTADDAEGHDAVGVGARQLQTWTRGIAANYKGADMLRDQRAGPAIWLRSPVRLGLMLLPPVAYMLLLGGVLVVRRRNADPLAGRQRRAFGCFRQALRAAPQGDHEKILAAISGYFADRFGLSPGAITFGDVRVRLAGAGVGDEELAALKDLFESCEAGRYGGGTVGDGAELRERAAAVIRNIEGRGGRAGRP